MGALPLQNNRVAHIPFSLRNSLAVKQNVPAYDGGVFIESSDSVALRAELSLPTADGGMVVLTPLVPGARGIKVKLFDAFNSELIVLDVDIILPIPAIPSKDVEKPVVEFNWSETSFSEQDIPLDPVSERPEVKPPEPRSSEAEVKPPKVKRGWFDW